MKKVTSILAWIFVVITSLCLVATMFSTYNVINLKCFNNYYIFQVSMVITMLLWSIKQMEIKSGDWINSLLCMSMGVITMVFMFMKVY